MASGKIATLSSGGVRSLPCSLRCWHLLLSIISATKSKTMPPAILKTLNEMARKIGELPIGSMTTKHTIKAVIKFSRIGCSKSEMTRHYSHRSSPGGLSAHYSTTAWRDNSIMLLQCYLERAYGRSEGGDE